MIKKERLKYIDFNQAKVDEANRRVLDFVFKK